MENGYSGCKLQIILRIGKLRQPMMQCQALFWHLSYPLCHMLGQYVYCSSISIFHAYVMNCLCNCFVKSGKHNLFPVWDISRLLKSSPWYLVQFVMLYAFTFLKLCIKSVRVNLNANDPYFPCF